MTDSLKRMKNKKLTVTIGIPTCYGGVSLVETVRGIRRAVLGAKTKVIVIADRTPIKPSVARELKSMNVRLIWNKTAGSQFKKIKQMVSLIKSDIIILTQDDVTFDSQTVLEIMKSFELNPKLTMIGSRVLPLKPVTFFESIMASMVRLVDRIGKYWSDGDNSLRASGRCMAFRVKHVKKFRFPETIINGDMFAYLENIRLHGVFTSLENAKVYIRCPQKMKDQLGPSSRYQFSRDEMKRFFSFDVTSEYKIPITVLARAFIEELFAHPVQIVLYILVFIYTRLNRQSTVAVTNPIWNVEMSTKKVIA